MVLGDATPPVHAFQSTPDIAVGRHDVEKGAQLFQASFNPRPTLLSGDTEDESDHDANVEVSIHARHCCRATPTGCRGEATFMMFQSTPDIAVGRHVAGDRLPAGHSAVSIHARHCCRATRASLAASTALVAFQSTPDIAVGRHTCGAVIASRHSSVSIHARHCCRATRPGRQAWHWPRCFNPRPTLLSGDTLRDQTTINKRIFSTLARTS